ncbi:DNA cytosine methyltransferase [Micromonospora chersina]|uniref:DNA cytosine methyltransferase n=1 Tax=Micromonospora chersina TaxID=47854 RepID=UPI0033EA595D
MFVENVAALRRRGLDVVHTDLAAPGYDTTWLCLRASDIGAAHRRDRLFLLAITRGGGEGALGHDPTLDLPAPARCASSATASSPPKRRPPYVSCSAATTGSHTTRNPSRAAHSAARQESASALASSPTLPAPDVIWPSPGPPRSSNFRPTVGHPARILPDT